MHIVEALDQLISAEEPAAGKLLAGYLEKEGIRISISARVARVQKGDDGFQIRPASNGRPSGCWWRPAGDRNLEGFELFAAGLATTEKGWLKVDSANPGGRGGHLGAGDVTGIAGFTHLASYHGVLIARALKGERIRANHSAIPRVTFTDPEVASVGLRRSADGSARGHAVPGHG